ncbi:MAG: shikimate dehydrogenase [Alphaproteobacteria bacterium]|jgi:shikimate dehydrogenase|nr:MAG: shikimate dehydrogenase [Alphaproteobacteria bacterium]
MSRKLFAVVGDPVSHSLSPLIHNRWIAEAGLDAHYSTIHLQSANAADDIRALATEYSGLNVTLPHKMAALEAALSATPETRAIGAANTLSRENGSGWTAHNTDVAGFSDALTAAVGSNRTNLSVVMIGAGGAARAAVASLAASGAKLAIVNRSVANAQALAADLAPGAETGELSQLAAFAETADVVVNSASLGHAGGSLPDLPAGRGRAFLDLSYGKAAAQILEVAARSGWTPHDGLPMLVGQAAAAFRIWFGISPDEAGALKACREAVAVRA